LRSDIDHSAENRWNCFVCLQNEILCYTWKTINSTS